MQEMTLVPRLLPSLLAVSLLAACGQQGSDAHVQATSEPVKNELARETERLLIADGQDAIVRVFDVAEGDVISNFPVGAAAASVYTGGSGRFAYAVQSGANQVSIVDGALVFEDHGDHQHYDKYDPILLNDPMAGSNPIHFVVHEAQVAAFFDNDGEALILNEASLLAPERIEVRIRTAMPHHGVAVPFAGSILVTRPELPAGASRGTPTGLSVHTMDGEATGQVFNGCPVVHGEAALATSAAFGCDDGVLLIKASDEGLTSQKLQNPVIGTEKRRVGTVIANEHVPFFVGNFGAGKYAELNPEKGSFEVFDAPVDYAQFIFSKDGNMLLFLGKEGQLAIVDAETRLVKHQSLVTAAATGIDYGARDAKMAAGKNYVYITNPVSSELVVFSLSTFKEVKRFKVAGKPAALTVINFPG